MGVQMASGNSDALRANGSASVSKETELNSYFLKSTGRYGESDDEQDAESATLEAKAQRRLSERMYAAVDGHVLHDRIADLSYRARTSVSLGRHFIWTGRTVLSVETGPGYVVERKGDDPEGFMAGRVAQHLEFMVTDSLPVWHSLEYVPNLEDSRVYFVSMPSWAWKRLETVLLANLSLRFTIEDRYDSHPAEGKKNNDLLTATALSWSF
jgi:putative salt-induced outer membrane protein YdiY